MPTPKSFIADDESQFTTKISPQDEIKFQSWVKDNNVAGADEPNFGHYDMRGYWKDITSQGSSETAINKQDGLLHYPDTYKQPGHETFSVESKYAKGRDDAGSWNGDTFIPAKSSNSNMPKSFVADSTDEDEKPKEGFLSRIASDVSDFVKNHPAIKRIGEELLTGTSPELEDAARNKAIESIKTGRDNEANRAELARLEAGGKQQILGDPAQEKSLLPSFKQPETFTGGFLNSLYEDFVKPLATPSGILSSSAPETSIPIRRSALHQMIDENAELPSQKLLEAPKTRFSVDAGGNAVDRTADLPIRSIERPYRSPESFSTANGDTEAATRAFNESVARHQEMPIPDHRQEMLDALSVKNEFEPWKGLTNIKEGLGRLGENFLGGSSDDIARDASGGIDWGPAAAREEAPIIAAEQKPTAKFRGWQEDGDGGAFPLFDIEGGTSHKSTVDAPHLAKLGIDIPETPKNPFGESKFFDEPATQEVIKPEETSIAKSEETIKPFTSPFEKPVEAPKSFVADEVKPVVEESPITEPITEPPSTIVNKEVKKLNLANTTEPTPQEKFAQSLGAKNGIVELQGGLGGVKPPKSARPVHTGPGGSAVNKLYDALESAHGDTESRMADLAAERARRFAASAGVKEEGLAGFRQRLSKMKGEYESYEPSDNLKLGRKQTDDLFTAITRANITESEKIRGGIALHKLIDGSETLQRNELKLLDDIFGGHFAENIIDLHGGIGAIGANISKVANTMKAAMSSGDVSAPLRQGIGLVHRPEYRDSFQEMFKYLAKPEYYDAAMQAIEQRPSYLLGRESGLFLSKPNNLLSGEEAFMNNYIHDIPKGAKGLYTRDISEASERAYTGFLNKLRSDTFDNMVKQAKIAGNDAFTVAEHTAEDGTKTKSISPTDVTKNIAKFINNATGRGNLGRFEKYAQDLNTVIWSPRLLASRLNALNPKYYAQLDPFTRKEALKSLLAIGAFGTTVASLGALAGGKVSKSPLSADFMKVRFGDKVLDPWGGFQQPIVAASRFITGSNEAGPQGRWDTLDRFRQSKDSPIASLAEELMRAKVFNGKTDAGSVVPPLVPGVGGFSDQYGKQKYISREVAGRFVPIFTQDMSDLLTTNPSLAETLGLGTASLLGMGTQNYPERSANRKLGGMRKFPSKLSF